MSEPRRTRKANLESTISTTPNTQGYYEAKVWMGFKSDGRPDRRHVQRRSLAAVRAQVKKLEAMRDDGQIVNPGRPPALKDMLERHINVVLVGAKRSPKTIASYRSLCEHQIYPRWGAQRTDRLTPEHIEDGLADMQRRGLADSTIRKVFAILSSAYQTQVARGNLRRNPCTHVTPPSRPLSNLPQLTVAEAAAVVSAALGRVNGARWALALGHGLRQGEALGLRWSFIDLARGKVDVWHQLQRITWQHGCTDGDAELALLAKPKERAARIAAIEHACGAEFHRPPCPARCPKIRASGRKHTCLKPGDKGTCPPGCTAHASMCPSRRDGGLMFRAVKEKRHKTIWLSEEFASLLRAHRDDQYLRRITADTEWEDHDLVFCQWNGRPIDPRRDWTDWKDLLSTAGLPAYRVHAMRHSAVSILLAEGVGIRVVQEIVGHSDIRVTELYADVSEEQSRDASSRIGKALGLPSARAAGE